VDTHLIAIPERVRFPLLIAVQVKHHHVARKTSVGSVREFAGAIYNKPFSAGLLVTNTSFTPSAKLFADSSLKPLFLRDLEALKRWISGHFLRNVEWRELPQELEIAPGIRVCLRSRHKM
jgi:Restriction endonuclease